MEQNPTDNSVDLTSTLVISASLSLAVLEFADMPIAGSVSGFAYFIQNNGPSDATDLTLTVNHPIESQFERSLGLLSCSSDTQTVTCTLANLAVGDFFYQNMFFSTDVNPQSLQYDTTLTSPDDIDVQMRENLVTLARQVKFEVVSFLDMPDPVNAGDPLSLQISLSNFGPSVTTDATLSLQADSSAPLISVDNQLQLDCEVATSGCSSMMIAPFTSTMVQFTVAPESSLADDFVISSTVTITEPENVACGTLFESFDDWLILNQQIPAGSALSLTVTNDQLDGEVTADPSVVIAITTPISLLDSPSTEAVDLSFFLDFRLGEFSETSPMGITDLSLYSFIYDSDLGASFAYVLVNTPSQPDRFQISLSSMETITVRALSTNGQPINPPLSINFATVNGVVTSASYTPSSSETVTISVSSSSNYILEVQISRNSPGPCNHALSLEASTDFGTSWQSVETDLPYVLPGQWCGILSPTVAPTPVRVTADLSSFLGEVIQLRFVLESGSPQVAPGISLLPDVSVSQFSLSYRCFVGLELSGSTATVLTTTATSADLQVASFTSMSPVVAGEELAYSVQIINNGPSYSRNVMVTIPYDSALSFTSSSMGSCTDNGLDQLVCTLATLEDSSTYTGMHWHLSRFIC